VEAQVGKKVWVIMRGEKEFTGTLTGYDEFISTSFAH
jgi:U6 snRNA-associated Sm-like protein LSm5